MRFGEEGFEGILPVRRLRGWWTLNEHETMLEADGSGRRLRLGDPVDVVVDRVETARGRVDLSPRRVHTRRRMAKKGKRKAAPGDVATNRQAAYRYNLLEKWEAGIELQGSEVKSLRNGGVQIKDAYAEVRDGEVWLHNMHIAPYEPAARENHEPERPRKLLLHRSARSSG